MAEANRVVHRVAERGLSTVERVLKKDPEPIKKEKSPEHDGGGTLNQRSHNSRHLEPSARQEGPGSSRKAEFELRETEGYCEIITAGSSYLTGAGRRNINCRHGTFEPEGDHS